MINGAESEEEKQEREGMWPSFKVPGRELFSGHCYGQTLGLITFL